MKVLNIQTYKNTQNSIKQNNTNSLSFKRYTPPDKNTEMISKIVNFIAGKRIAIAGHSSPDGDAGGSMLGLGRMIRKSLQQIPTIFTALPLPPNINFMAKRDEITVVSNVVPKSITKEKDIAEFLKEKYGKFDVFIGVDTPNLGSFDSAIRDGIILPSASKVKIDHHNSSLPDSNFADLSVVDSTLDSNSQLVMQFAKDFNLSEGKITSDISDPLTMGLVTDTVQLAETKPYSYTSAFIDLADLSKTSNVSDIINKSGKLTLDGFNDYNYMINNVQYDKKANAMYYIIDNDKHPNAVKALRQKFTNFIKNIEGIEYSFCITKKRQSNGTDKLAVSMRSNDKSLANIAKILGGGCSNPLACGIKTTGNANELAQKIIYMLQEN